MIELGRIDHGLRIAKAVVCLLDVEHDVVISRTDDYGKLLGGVVYYDFTGKSIAMHIAGFSPHWMCRDLIWLVFHYAFVQLGCASVFSEIRSRNITTIALAKKMGFYVEVVLPEVFPEDDLVVCRMRKEDCRWLNIKPRSVTFSGNMKKAA